MIEPDDDRPRQEPTAVGDLLDGVLEGLGMVKPVEVGELVRRWDTVAPEPFATAARPVGLASGELTLEVADGAAASRLRYQLGTLMARLDVRLGAGVVTGVRLRVRRS